MIPRVALVLAALLVHTASAAESPLVLHLESFVLDDGRLKVEVFVAPDVPAGALSMDLPAGSAPLGACGHDVCERAVGRVRRARRRGVVGRRLTLVAALPVAAKLARAIGPDRTPLIGLRVDGRVGTVSTVVQCRERGRSFVCTARTPPHVLVVVTGDQRQDTLTTMPGVQRELVMRGASLVEAFATTPVSCASRASILTGLYADHHGARTCAPPDGGATAFEPADQSTIATWLAAAGYRTGYFGQYLDGYDRLGPPERAQWYVPPGWQRWLALRGPASSDDELVSEDGQVSRHGEDSTGVLATAARAWIEQGLAGERPVLVHFAPPATELRVVDEAVAGLIALMREHDAERDTLVVYTSDRGGHRGGTPCPYDECIRVPLVLRYGPLVPERAVLFGVAEHVDVAPTIASLAGVLRPAAVDGRDLVPLIEGSGPAWRKAVLLEAWGAAGFVGVRGWGWKLVRHRDGGDVELYDVVADPDERGNLAAVPEEASRRAGLEAEAAALAAAPPAR